MKWELMWTSRAVTDHNGSPSAECRVSAWLSASPMGGRRGRLKVGSVLLMLLLCQCAVLFTDSLISFPFIWHFL